MNPLTAIREVAVIFSIQTKTPVTYWFEMPLVELGDWGISINAVLERMYPKGDGK